MAQDHDGPGSRAQGPRVGERKLWGSPRPFPINRSEKPGPEGLGQEMGYLAVAMTDGKKEGLCWDQTWRPTAHADGRQGGARRADPEDKSKGAVHRTPEE